MKKQLLIMFNTLLLAFAFSSCGQSTNNPLKVKKSLNLKVIDSHLDNSYYEDKLINLFDFLTHKNEWYWSIKQKTNYEVLSTTTTFKQLSNYSDGEKYLELNQKSINLIYSGVNQLENGATDWWCINDCSKYLNIAFVVKYVKDNNLVNKIKRILITKIISGDNNHKYIDDFIIISENNQLYDYRKNKMNSVNEGVLKHTFTSPILRSQGWRADNYSSICLASGNWSGVNNREDNIVSNGSGIDQNIQCYLEFGETKRIYGGIKKAVNYYPVVTWNDHRTTKLGAKLVIGRNGNATNSWSELKNYGVLHYYTIFFKYDNAIWWFKYGAHNTNRSGPDKEDSKDSLIKRKNPNKWYKVTDFNGLLYRNYIFYERYQEYYVVPSGNKLYFKTVFNNNFKNENELGVLYIKDVYE